MDKLLARWENHKKYKHGKQFHEQQKHFFLFVISVDGMLEKEYLFILTRLSQFMVEKMYKPILHVRGWINGRIAIAFATSYSCMIRED